MIYFTWQQ